MKVGGDVGFLHMRTQQNPKKIEWYRKMCTTCAPNESDHWLRLLVGSSSLSPLARPYSFSFWLPLSAVVLLPLHPRRFCGVCWGGVWFWCTIIDLRLDDCVAFGVGGWFLGRYPSWTGAGIATHLVSLPFVFAVAIRIDCYEVSWGKVSFDEWVILYVVYEAVRPWWYWELAEMRLAVLPCQLPFPYWYTCMPLNGGEVCWSA